MVINIERLKFHFKLDNHHHEDEALRLQASLRAFRSEVSNLITRMALESKPGISGTLSLEWIEECFKLLPMINRAFAKLVLEVDYPFSKWDARSMEDYLKYSLKLLDSLNLISSCLSHLGQERLSLSHALTLVESSPCAALERLKPIGVMSLSKDLMDAETKEEEKGSFSCLDNKGEVITQALVEVKSIWFWVCGVALAGLSGDAEAYFEMVKVGSFLSSSLLVNLGSSVFGGLMEEGRELGETKEVNKAAARLTAALEAGESSGDETEEMKSRLKGFEKLLDGLGREVESLFSEVLAARRKLLDSIRLKK